LTNDRDLFINILDPANTMFTEKYVKELQDGKVAAENVTSAAPWDDTKQTLSRFSEWLAFCEKYHDTVQLVTRAEDLENARSRGKVGIILGLQAANPIPWEDISFVGVFHRLGLRTLGIAYQGRNAFGDGCGEPKDSGLSKLGEKLVDEVNRRGIVLDLSHTGKKATLEAIELSREPVIFSHSNVKALCDNVRNLDDDQIKALAEKKGVVGIAAYGPLLRTDRRGTIDDMIDHVDYLVKLVGVDSVGLGLDAYPPTPPSFRAEFKRRFPEIGGAFPFDSTVERFEHPAEWKNIVNSLSSRGYSENDIRKILGENVFRIFKRVWRS
jgi:membrane dipeptidase